MEGEGRGVQPPSKPPFVPKPPKRRPGKLKRAKISNYDWESARDTLGITHNFQVYSAAISSTASIGNAAATINSPTKEEVKSENKKLKEQADMLEHKIGSLESSNIRSKRKVECLQTHLKSLSDSL